MSPEIPDDDANPRNPGTRRRARRSHGENVALKTVAIIQARIGSTRLPGKVLRDLGGTTVLDRVVERVRKFTLVDDVLVATSDRSTDDSIVNECRRIDVAWFRGNEEDVLERFAGAAQSADASVCVRLTADCPLLDPESATQ